MSTALLTLSENGELQKIHDKWLARKVCDSQATDLVSDQLQLQSFWGLFLICGIACFLALLAHFCMMINQYIRHSPEEPEEQLNPCTVATGTSRSARISTFLSFADKKEDAWKKYSKRKRSALSLNGYGDEGEPRGTPRSLEIEESGSPPIGKSPISSHFLV